MASRCGLIAELQYLGLQQRDLKQVVIQAHFLCLQYFLVGRRGRLLYSCPHLGPVRFNLGLPFDGTKT